jgi:hypothetical protein
MRSWIALLPCICLATSSWADSLRVGQQVLLTGDSAARVVELLGPPVHKASGAGGAGTPQQKNKRSAKGKGRAKPGGASTADKAASGERWQYRQGRRTVTIVLVQGRVVRIE